MSQSTVNNVSPEESKTMSRVTVCEQAKAEMKESLDRQTHGKRLISDLSTPSSTSSCHVHPYKRPNFNDSADNGNVEELIYDEFLENTPQKPDCFCNIRNDCKFLSESGTKSPSSLEFIDSNFNMILLEALQSVPVKSMINQMVNDLISTQVKDVKDELSKTQQENEILKSRMEIMMNRQQNQEEIVLKLETQVLELKQKNDGYEERICFLQGILDSHIKSIQLKTKLRI